VTGVLVAALLLFVAAPATAQAVRLVGAVQWVAGVKMQVMTDGGSSIAVDLMEADQSTYRGLRSGDRVLIDGVVSSDRRRVIALEIWRDSGRGTWTQSP
jgi:hypothetical protein